MDEPEDESSIMSTDETELKDLLGLFDVPAFARRGRDLEYGLRRLDQRLERERAGLLAMVHLRLRQWASVATGPADWREVLTAPVASLYPLAGAEEPVWASLPPSARRRRAVACDLVASVTRFNRRWLAILDQVKLDPINRQIDLYNRYYVLEKECVLGSTRLAAQHFVPQPHLSRDRLLRDHPTLPVPALVG
jgi:hypothetical protein